MKTLTAEQIAKLKSNAESLFQQGTESTKFCRLLHNLYQIFCNDEIDSPDDFYNMSRPENMPMRNLLNMLGYNYTKFGICRL